MNNRMKFRECLKHIKDCKMDCTKCRLNIRDVKYKGYRQDD